MVAAPCKPAVKPYDIYLGRKDTILFAHSILNTLFPVASSSTKHPFGPWLAYTLYRTMLPDEAVHHALNLLRRLSVSYGALPDTTEELFHHRLMTAALVLTTKYWMDDAYSNKSWSVATKSLFTLDEVNGMELELLRALELCVVDREQGESVDSIVRLWNRERQLWKESCAQQQQQHPLKSYGGRTIGRAAGANWVASTA